MEYIFKECISLTSIYIPDIEASKLTSFKGMFSGCCSLKSLDLSNYKTTKITDFSYMFNGSSSLEYINMGYINYTGVPSRTGVFRGTPGNLIICGEYDKWRSLLDEDSGEFISIFCNKSNSSESSININDKCYLKNSTTQFNNQICNQCGKYYYITYSDLSYNKSNINCQKIPDGYYLDLDEINPILKPCFQSCKTCEKGGNESYHNCLECKEDYHIFNLNSMNYKNCYKEIGNEIETELVTDKNINTERDIEIEINDFNALIFQYNKTFIDNGNDIEMKKGSVLYIYSSTENQRKYENDKNKTSINLMQCKERLMQFNNIPLNDSLYILKYEINIEGMKIPKTEYEVYYPLYNGTFTKLNLTECKGIHIEISYPIKLNESLDKYNASSDYYNNLCHKTTSNYGTDISLTDRKDKFIEDNMTLCEEDCSLIDYNYTTEKAKCSCLIKITLPFFDEIKFDKDKLYKSFIDVKNIANINLMKCYKEVFKGKNLLKNYGFYIFIALFALYFVCFILFYSKFYFLLIKKINDIEKAKRFQFKLNKDEKGKKIKTKNDITSNISNMNNINNYDNKSQNVKSEFEKKIKRKKRKVKLDNMFPPKKTKSKGKTKIKTLLDNNNDKNNNIDELTMKGKKNKKKKDKNIKFKLPDSKREKDENIIDKEKYKKILEYSDYEINSLLYKKALQFDKRTFIQYYFSLLRLNHSLVFSFYSHEKDYNSQIIKIFLFFFFFSVHFTINALFFSDETMHTIYIDEGHFNFIYQISQIIYSSLISAVVSIIIKFLSLTEKSVIEMKSVEKKEEFDSVIKKLGKIIKIKFVIFFIISFLLLGFFGFYISCFCGIYVNTQIHLIKDSIISFGLSLVYPFGIYLLPGIFRILALNAKKKNRECLYKFSQLIQNL